MLGLLVSPTHRYRGRPADGASPLPDGAPPELRDRVEVVAGVGVPGDRYAGRAAHLGASVSIIAAESLDAVAESLGASTLDWTATRRTVLVRGADLNGLVGSEFTLDCGGLPVTLRARGPASPCGWMDHELAPGAHQALRGRGGVRCEVLGSGELALGPALLRTTAVLDPAKAGTRVLRPGRLP